MSYNIDKTYALATNEGDSRKAQNLYIIAHETANPRATGLNEAVYMKRNWRNAYTHFIVGDGGKVWQIGEPGYVAWGALSANPYSPMQVELQHSLNHATFKKNYAVYIELIRDYAKKYGIPLTLDAGGKGTKGVKSHLWVTNNYGGNHTDPYGYLSKMGISKAQFAKDIANGVGGRTPAHTPKQSNNAKPNQTKFAVGTTVQVLSNAYAYQTGQTIPGFVKGKRYKVKQVKEVNQSHSKYAFLLEGINSWFLAQDLKQVSKPSKPAKAGGYKVGQTVTLLNKATRYQTGQPIASFAKNKKYKILQVKNVNQSNSKQAVLLSGIMSWVLAQDVK